MNMQDIKNQFRSGSMTKADYVEAMHAIHKQLIDYAAFIQPTDVTRIEIAEGRVVLTCASGLKLQYDDPLDQHVTPLTLLNFDGYEPEDSRMLFRLMADLAGTGPFTFLDIGANVGWYALSVALRFPAAAVHAFEPVPSTFLNLQKNLAVNGLANVRAHNLGFMDEAGQVAFYFDPGISGRTSTRNVADDPAALPVACAVTRLDDLVQAEGIAPDVLKVDVEGAELAVFRGGLETLRRHRPLVFTEMLRKWAARFGYHPDAILGLFAELGYRCFFVQDGRLAELERMTEDVAATNFFFLHGEKHQGLQPPRS
jgi:FkbM family methyltransferase